jgi:hypothetical protein
MEACVRELPVITHWYGPARHNTMDHRPTSLHLIWMQASCSTDLGLAKDSTSATERWRHHGLFTKFE